jgi:hypothetical protein
MFEDFIQDLSISRVDQDRIKSWLSKYESDYDFSNDDTFEENQDKMVSDCINDLNISASLKDDVKSFIQGEQDLSDDMQTVPGVVMDPKARSNYNQIDSVQRFQY